MFGFGMFEAVILMGLLLLFFGGKKIPELGGALGKALVNFKKGLRDSSSHSENHDKLKEREKRQDSDEIL